MRIAIVSSLNGGVGKFTYSLVNQLNSNDNISKIDIYGFVTRKKIPLPSYIKKNNYVNEFSHPLLLFLWLFVSIGRMKHYDVIQVHQAVFLLPTSFVKLLNNKIKLLCSSRTAYIFEHLTGYMAKRSNR